MTTDEAPERIWLTAESTVRSIPEYAAEGEGVEYVRADLVIKELAKAAHVGEVQQERIEQLERERNEWKARSVCVCDGQTCEHIEKLERDLANVRRWGERWKNDSLKLRREMKGLDHEKP